MSKKEKTFNVTDVSAEFLAKEFKLDLRQFSEVTSTNLLAKEDAFSEGPDSDQVQLWIAEHQSEGRGRGENVWESPSPGMAFLGSFVFDCPPKQPEITAAIGKKILGAVKEAWPLIPAEQKLPNDLLAEGKKFCGILVESVQKGSQNRVIVGLGINVFAYPESLADQATCLAKYEEITPEDWEGFLKKSYKGIRSVLALP